MGRPPLPSGLVATTTSLRLTPAYRAALAALVDDDNRRAEAAGSAARASDTDVLRALILRAFRERGLHLPEGMPGAEAFGALLSSPTTPPSPVVSPRAEPLPLVESSTAAADRVLAQLVKLGARATEGLVDVAELVRASGLPTADGHAALRALAAAGDIELRPDTSPDLRSKTDAALYPPAPGGGVVGYVRRLSPNKVALASSRDAKPGKKIR